MTTKQSKLQGKIRKTKDEPAIERTPLDSALDEPAHPDKPLTIDDLGWTREKAAAVRGLFDSIAEDWDDPSMDIYDEL